MLTPNERMRVDAAGEGSYQALHRDSVAEVVQDLKSNRASAVLVSVTRCDSRARAGVAALVREFPRVPTVALLTQLDRSTPQTMLSLGSTGVRQLVDVREADGWRELRNCLLSTRGEDIQRQALGQLAIDLVRRAAGLLALLRGAVLVAAARRRRCACSRGGSMCFRARS